MGKAAGKAAAGHGEGALVDRWQEAVTASTEDPGERRPGGRGWRLPTSRATKDLPGS